MPVGVEKKKDPFTTARGENVGWKGRNKEREKKSCLKPS